MNFFSVITSINPPNNCTKSIVDSELIKKLIVVADKKSQKQYKQNNCFYFDLFLQQTCPFELKNKIPFNHYSRKNLGYLMAFQMGAELIYDTDDDNLLISGFNKLGLMTTNQLIQTNSNNSYCNIYRYFTNQFIWPRGLPLDEIKNENKFQLNNLSRECDVIQFLANGDTDVDSIYRLIFDKHVKFKENLSISLDKNIFCPTNSQSTIFTKTVFPLLYLPISVSFRFTDILRGIVLKNILDLNSLHLGFKSPIAFQERNKHNYMKDFESEVSMFVNVKKAYIALSSMKRSGSISQDLINSYIILHEEEIVDSEEIKTCETWVKDIESI